MDRWKAMPAYFAQHSLALLFPVCIPRLFFSMKKISSIVDDKLAGRFRGASCQSLARRSFHAAFLLGRHS
jgi:hypothetical protein